MQCELCEKWRRIQPTMHIASFTGAWTCSDNHWDANGWIYNGWIYNDSNTQAAFTISSNRRVQQTPPPPLSLPVLLPPVGLSPPGRSRSLPVSVGRQTIPLQSKCILSNDWCYFPSFGTAKCSQVLGIQSIIFSTSSTTFLCHCHKQQWKIVVSVLTNYKKTFEYPV